MSTTKDVKTASTGVIGTYGIATRVVRVTTRIDVLRISVKCSPRLIINRIRIGNNIAIRIDGTPISVEIISFRLERISPTIRYPKRKTATTLTLASPAAALAILIA